MRGIWTLAAGVAAVLATTAGFAGTPGSNLRSAPGTTALDLASLLGAPLNGLRPIHPAGGLVDCDAEPGIIIHDDGTVETGYTGDPRKVSEVRFVDRFTPSGYPATFSSICVAFVTLGQTSLDFDVVVFDDDGIDGAPGTELGSLAVTANGIPKAPGAPNWFSYDISSLAIEVTEGSVYIGVRYAPPSPGEETVFIAVDESAGNPPGFAGGYWWDDFDGPWVPTHDPDLGFPEYRSLMVRAVEGPAPTPFVAASLAVDTAVGASDGNGVFEPGEQVDVVPGWRNGGSNPEMLFGTAADFNGPTGADYTLVDGEAGYGEIAVGETATCQDGGDCYEMAVEVPAVRPAILWEATFEETLDDVDGTTKIWTLHIGYSFTDVPRSNLFYTAIETLLGSGVTGGCGDGSAYCPGDANTRSQMPAFMRKALEGPDYSPPACDAGDERLFDDVPASNLFCPWIEELANRGIVSGCGDGNYCPSAAVTRAQMAIFLLKTLEGSDYTPEECSGQFDDVPCPSLFADWIEDLAGRGITQGCSATDYCPTDAVTRGQMASFITRTFGFTLYGP